MLLYEKQRRGQTRLSTTRRNKNKKKLTKFKDFVKRQTALSIVPNVNCGCKSLFILGAVNWISINGIHWVGWNSGSAKIFRIFGLNTSKHFEQIVIISINLKNNLKIVFFFANNWKYLKTLLIHCCDNIF